MSISIIVPAKPDWEPFDVNDVLENDGYFQAMLTKISQRGADSGSTPGAFLNFTIEDEDCAGAVIGKFVGSKDKDVTFIYRQMVYSATGDKATAKSGFEITEAWCGQLRVWLKTGEYLDDKVEKSQEMDALNRAAERNTSMFFRRAVWQTIGLSATVAIVVAVAFVALGAGAIALKHVETSLIGSAGESLALAAVDIRALRR